MHVTRNYLSTKSGFSCRDFMPSAIQDSISSFDGGELIHIVHNNFIMSCCQDAYPLGIVACLLAIFVFTLSVK